MVGKVLCLAPAILLALGMAVGVRGDTSEKQPTYIGRCFEKEYNPTLGTASGHGSSYGQNPIQAAHNVHCNQTRTGSLDDHDGGLGVSVDGYFPTMSDEKIGLGCGLNWANGQLHAGFDGGDPKNGIGGGFTWTPNAISSITGVHFGDTKINLNLTITKDQQIILEVNDKKVDWNACSKPIDDQKEEGKEGYADKAPSTPKPSK